MWNDRGLRWFLIVVVFTAAFVAASGALLPPVVASHFGAGGAANGMMSRRSYLVVLLLLIIALPSAMVLLTWGALGRPGARINLPNGEYWLAPEHREQTIGRIRGAMLRFSTLLLVFLCYAHALVVRANRSFPPQLDEVWFLGGLAAFLATVIIGTIGFLRPFRRAA